MHGEIISYSANNKCGIILDANNNTLMLNEDAWIDVNILPQANLFIEYEYDQEVRKCRASRYQRFDTLIEQNEFMETMSDIELAQKIQDKKLAKINDVFNQTDYENLSNISPTLSIKDSIDRYFDTEFYPINHLKPTSATEETLEYFKIKVYLHRALEYLKYIDKDLTIDKVYDKLALLKKLEFYYAKIQDKNKIKKKIYTEYFLEEQYEFMALQKMIDECSKDTKMSKNLNKLQQISNIFYEKQLQEYWQIFDLAYESKVEKILLYLNICATNLDNTIWNLSTKNATLNGRFFQYDICGSFCSMTFLCQDIRFLQYDLASTQIQEIIKYYDGYVANNMQYFVIYSCDEEFVRQLKIKILTTNKHYILKICQDEESLYSYIDVFAPKKCFIDSDIKVPTKYARNITKISIDSLEKIEIL